ncbi:uncharacterized protein [Watersipora subatra]|uniref:uncharacterized protein n=1 Tax=Watersipora subatra TaxID=2589382 RepID=UPI00355B89B8
MAAAQLQNDFRDVLELGHTWGMSKSEIQDCLRVVVDLHSPASINESSSQSDVRQEQFLASVGRIMFLVYRFLKCIVIGLVAVVILLVIIYNAILLCCFLSPTFENRIGKITAPLTYPAMRYARIFFKPLADTFGISDVYSSECLVENPFFVDPIEDCGPCQTKFRIVELTSSSVDDMVESVGTLTPFFVKSFSTKKIDLTALQKMYYENEKQFKLGGSKMFASNMDDVYSITDFFSKYNHEDMMNERRGTGYVAWYTNSVPSSQAIRKLSPRPEFVLEQSEISLLKGIFIEGPYAGDHILPIGGFANSWYLQAQGERRITLWPHPDCTRKCNEMSITLQAGDLVSYQDQFWRLESSPVIGQGSQELSIGFAASFAL